MAVRYLVTGGCGFIGSHLVEALLNSGAEVVVVDNLSTGRLENISQTVRLIRGDVRDQTLLRVAAENCSGIFHLAAVASVPKCNEEWYASHTVNLSASICVFEAAVQMDLPVVYASSSAVYGIVKRTPIRENAPKHPISPYGADKLAMELHAAAGAYVHQLRSFGLRFFNVYGPRQDPSSAYSGVISVFVSRARKHHSITIHGDGKQVRDFVYVTDAVSACCAAMEELAAQS